MKRFNSLIEMADVLSLNSLRTPDSVDISQEELNWYVGYLPASPKGVSLEREWYFKGTKLNVTE